MSDNNILTVDIVSDVICPWCFVGKRRLERALKAVPGGRTVRVRWLPFQLNPQMPTAGMNRREYRSAKFGSWARSQELDAQVVAVGATEGIAFAYDRVGLTPNTLDAHRLIALAAKEGVQDAVGEALFRGYFTEGCDISDLSVLLDVGAGPGRREREMLRPKVVIIGGSLGGLFNAIALRDLGCDVSVFEKSSGLMRDRGAGIVLQSEVTELFRRYGVGSLEEISVLVRNRRYLNHDGGVAHELPMAQAMTSWDMLYRKLRASFSDDNRGTAIA